MTSSRQCQLTRSARGTVANRRRALVLVTVASVPLGLAIGLLCWWGFSWPVGVVGFVVATVIVGLIMWWAAEPLARRSLGGEAADEVRHHARCSIWSTGSARPSAPPIRS